MKSKETTKLDGERRPCALSPLFFKSHVFLCFFLALSCRNTNTLLLWRNSTRSNCFLRKNYIGLNESNDFVLVLFRALSL